MAYTVGISVWEQSVCNCEPQDRPPSQDRSEPEVGTPWGRLGTPRRWWSHVQRTVGLHPFVNSDHKPEPSDYPAL